jgi:predicted hydrolase (HD superfamily)
MTHRIDIPNARQPEDATIAMLRSCGVDPDKVARHSLAREMLMKWARREWTDAEIRKAFRNLLILNPSLRA